MKTSVYCMLAGLSTFAQAGTTIGPQLQPTQAEAEPNTQIFADPHRQFVKALKPLPEIKVQPEPKLIHPGEMEVGPLVVSLSDVAVIPVQGADGKTRVAHEGDLLEMGDSIQTGEKGSVRVAFEKGVQVLAVPGTILHLGQESVAGPSGGLEVPMIEIERGEARILVEAKGDGLEEKAKPLKLLVRTKSSAYAVRGTDFIVNVAGEHTTMVVINGVVEAALDPPALGAGRIVRVAASESIDAFVGRPFPKAEHYEMGVMLKDFNDRNPRLEEIWHAALRDIKARRLASIFFELRTRKADSLNLPNGFAPTAIRRETERLERETGKKTPAPRSNP